MIKFSIIIPVYNVEKYVGQCLESISRQTYDNYEVVVVNDGSTDRSFEVCKDYSRKNGKIKVIDQTNKGQGAARNTGIEYSTGDFLIFMDSDDWLDNDKCLEAIAKSISEDTEMVVYGLKRNTNMDWLATERLNGFMNLPNSVNSGEKYIREMLKINTYFPWGPCNMAVSKKYWMCNKFMFPEGKVYEDLGLIWKVICRVKKLVVLKKIIYIYRVDRPNSTTKISSKFVVLSHADMLRENVLSLRNEKFSAQLEASVMRTFATDYFAFLLSLHYKYSTDDDEVNDLLSELFLLFKETKKIPKHRFVYYIINIFGFKQGLKLVRMLQKIKDFLENLKTRFKIA